MRGCMSAFAPPQNSVKTSTGDSRDCVVSIYQPQGVSRVSPRLVTNRGAAGTEKGQKPDTKNALDADEDRPVPYSAAYISRSCGCSTLCVAPPGLGTNLRASLAGASRLPAGAVPALRAEETRRREALGGKAGMVHHGRRLVAPFPSQRPALASGLVNLGPPTYTSRFGFFRWAENLGLEAIPSASHEVFLSGS